MAFSFSERQARTVAAAITVLAAVIIILAIGAIVYLGALFLRSFSSVFLPIAVGAVASMVFRPYYDWLGDKLRLPAPIALVAILLSILLPVAGFLWFFGSIIADQLTDLVSRVPEWWEQLVASARERWPQVIEFFQTNPYGQKIRDVVEGQQEHLLEGLQSFGERALSAGAGLVRGLGALLSWAVLPVYFAFFLMVRPKSFDLEQLMPFLKAETRKDVVFLIHEFVDIVVAFFRGQLIVAFLQGILYAIGFSLVGLKYGFIIGLLLGFLNIIPYLGSIIGLGTALPLAFFQNGGGWTILIAVLVVFTVVQTIEGYLLTPKIVGDRTGLHFMAIIVAVFFWGAALDGILGMILAIPLTAFLVSFWRLARDKYIGELL